MPLTDKAIRAARHAQKSKRLFDGGGLYIEIAPKGGKWWRLASTHLPERRKMMQAWADYLDALKAGAKVTGIGKRAA